MTVCTADWCGKCKPAVVYSQECSRTPKHKRSQPTSLACVASLLQSTRTGTAYLHEEPPGRKCFQLYMKAVELLSAAHLLLLVDLLGSVCLHDKQAEAHQIGPPLCHDGCTSLPQLLLAAAAQIVRSVLTTQKG